MYQIYKRTLWGDRTSPRYFLFGGQYFRSCLKQESYNIELYYVSFSLFDIGNEIVTSSTCLVVCVCSQHCQLGKIVIFIEYIKL